MEVETPHNYLPNTDEYSLSLSLCCCAIAFIFLHLLICDREKVVEIPGATHLIVMFDPRCSTEKVLSLPNILIYMYFISIHWCFASVTYL